MSPETLETIEHTIASLPNQYETKHLPLDVFKIIMFQHITHLGKCSISRDFLIGWNQHLNEIRPGDIRIEGNQFYIDHFDELKEYCEMKGVEMIHQDLKFYK
jgi:hypothetical protein